MAAGVYCYETKAGPRWRIVYDGRPTLDSATGQVERKQKQRRGFERRRMLGVPSGTCKARSTMARTSKRTTSPSRGR